MPSGRWEGNEWIGSIYRTRGSAWYGKAYGASRYSLSEVGSFRIRFQDLSRATFEWSVERHRGSVPIEKQVF